MKDKLLKALSSTSLHGRHEQQRDISAEYLQIVIIIIIIIIIMSLITASLQRVSNKKV
jgi:hypothetical protein